MLTTFAVMLDSDNDKDKLTKIYKKYYGTMLMIANGIINDHALAEDAVSDSIMTIMKYLNKIGEIESHKTKAYIVIIVRSRALNLLKKQKNYKTEPIDDFDLPDNGMSTLDNLTMRESYEGIISQIRSLPKSLSDALYLSSVLEHSVTEISNIFGISNDAVRQRLSRARAIIKKFFKEGGVLNVGKQY